MDETQQPQPQPLLLFELLFPPQMQPPPLPQQQHRIRMSTRIQRQLPPKPLLQPIASTSMDRFGAVGRGKPLRPVTVHTMRGGGEGDRKRKEGLAGQAGGICVSRRNGGGFCPRRTGRLSSGDPISFRRKEIGKRKGGEGDFSSPSPLPPKRAAYGRPPH